MLRLIVIALILLALLGGAMAWSLGGGDATRADFTFINRGDHKTLDPGTMSWLQDIRMADALWEGLYTLDPVTLGPTPGVADKLDVDATGKIYTFHLRPEARWCNGDEVTTKDFVFAWRRALENPAEYSALLYYIKGAKDYSDAFVDWTSKADERNAPTTRPAPDFSTVGIAAIDDRTLRVTLPNPTPFFTSLCAMPVFFPEHEPSMKRFARLDPNTGRVQSYDEGFTRPPNLVSNGPYRLAEWVFKRKVRIVASDYYWNRAAVHCRVIDEPVDAGALPNIRAYLSGRVDWLSWVEEDLIGQMRQKGGYPDLHTFQGFGTEFYVIYCPPTLVNGQKNPLADVRVRRALALAIDKQPIIATACKAGQPIARDYIPPGAFKDYVSPAGLGYDPAEARRLLAEAGYPDGKGFPEIPLIYNNEMVQHADMAIMVRNQWEANLHIPVDAQPVEVKVYGARLHSHDFMVARASWIGDYPDPTTFTDKFKSDNDNNDGLWANKQYDDLCAAAETQTDPVKRMQLFSQAENIMLGDVAVIPMFHYVDAYMFRPNVKGVQLDPRDMIMFQAVRKD